MSVDGSSWPRAPLLMVASSTLTGPAEGQIELARFLRSRGMDAQLAVDTKRPGDICGHLRLAGVPWLGGLRMSRKIGVWDLPGDAAALRALVREGGADVLHAAFSHDHHLALYAARRTGALVVRTAHRRIDATPAPYRRWLYRRTDGIVVHAEAYRRALLAGGLREERVLEVPGGVDSSRFSPGRVPGLRGEWGVPEDAPLAGIVARMKPERLHDRLLEAWRLVKTPGARLVLVGRGEDEPRLRALAPEGVVFGGYRTGPGLVDAYRALDAAVWLREGNDGACRGVLEAMACGVPVIAGNDGAPPELVGETGLVVDPRSPAGIAAALDRLLGGLSLARRLGAAARARAEQFTLERYCEVILSFWRSLHAMA